MTTENKDYREQAQFDPRVDWLRHLQPNQYASRVKKSQDPDWYMHRYRDSKDRAMVSAVRELIDQRNEVLRLQAENAELRKQLETARRDALEEAANSIDGESDKSLQIIVAAIRSNIRSLSQPTTEKERA